MITPAIKALIAYAAAAPARDPGQGTWDDGLDSAFSAGEMAAQFEAAKRIREALAEMGLASPIGRTVCSECGRYESDGHADGCSLEAAELEEEAEILLRIDYACPSCAHEWEEQWPCACDSQCPECGTQDIQASAWEDAAE